MGSGKKLGRKCTVCAHKERTEIELAILHDFSFRDISRQYGVSRSAVDRHRPHILVDVIHSEHEKRLKEATKVVDELKVLKETALLLRDACDRELRDPEDPTRYFMGPRSWDVAVVYDEDQVIEEDGDGNALKVRKVRKKAQLSELLQGVPNVFSVNVKQPAPADVILKALSNVLDHLELVAKLTGELKAGQLNVNTQINVLETSAEWIELREQIIRALRPYPEALAAVRGAIGGSDVTTQ
jgi:predicted DNA-binding protein YlxM (UPF0122 family)